MPTGTVKWFNNAKGYGFILPDQGGEDLFVHYSSIQMDGYKTLKAGQEVLFDVIQGSKGFHATNIQVSASKKASSDGKVSSNGKDRDKKKTPEKKSNLELDKSDPDKQFNHKQRAAAGNSKLETVP